MRWMVKLLLSVIIITGAVYLFARFAPGIPVSTVTTQKLTLFTVEGDGKVTVVPDTGIVSLGINTTKNSVKDAQSEANRVVNQITADVRKLGIDDKDIKTENYSIYPEYDYQNNNPARITGYRINITLTIRVRQLEKINSVIDTATADGANTVGGIQLTVDDTKQKELLRQARQQAINEAKEKAGSLAAAAGITLGRVVNVQEGASSAPRPMYMAAEKIGMGGGAADTNIQAGSTDITSHITLSYETR
jgi:uncharacterized protein